MLNRLSIRDLAIIERLDLDVGPGLTLLTGETGAGKSIVVDALQLLLGGRGGAEWVRAGAEEMMVAGEFDLSRVPAAQALLAEADLADPADANHLFLRRAITRTGRSKALVNDRPTSLSTLARLGRCLVDICGQHEHTRLIDPESHLGLLDAFAGHSDRLRAVAEAHAESARLHALRRERKAALRDREQRRDFLRFQLQELEGLDLRPGEWAELSREADTLSQAERLGGMVRDALRQLSGEESGGGPSARIAKARRFLDALTGKIPEIVNYISQLEQARTLLDDTEAELDKLGRSLRPNPARLDAIIGRQEKAKRLARKHNCDVEALLARRDALGAELSRLDHAERDLEALDEKIMAADATLRRAADALSASRKKAAEGMGAQVAERLRRVALERAVFQVSCKRADAQEGGEDAPSNADGVSGASPVASERGGGHRSREESPDISDYPPCGSLGADRVEYLFSANPGEPARPLGKIASGGELSRVMLAIKSVLAERDPVPTVVYDEVDTGIGGQTAGRLGELILSEARARQVLCITHLAQIAVYADDHWLVRKQVVENAGGVVGTRVEVARLAADERVSEVARMMGADPHSRAARTLAETMITKARGRGAA